MYNNNIMIKKQLFEHHGRETYCTYYGQYYVMKHPLAETDAGRDRWLKKQERTKTVIDEIANIGNPAYNIPRMYHVSSQEYSVLEERALGYHLTNDLYRKLSPKQKIQIIYGIASFLVDMNELKPVNTDIIPYEFNHERMKHILQTKLTEILPRTEILYLDSIYNTFQQNNFATYCVWSHGDLNTSNIIYDPETNKLSFIDFAETGYKSVYHDMFSISQIELGICKNVYEQYNKLHDKSLYKIPSPHSATVPNIIYNRILTTQLKRIIKAADDIHLNTTSDKGKNNNQEKIEFIQNIIRQIQKTSQLYKK